MRLFIAAASEVCTVSSLSWRLFMVVTLLVICSGSSPMNWLRYAWTLDSCSWRRTFRSASCFSRKAVVSVARLALCLRLESMKKEASLFVTSATFLGSEPLNEMVKDTVPPLRPSVVVFTSIFLRIPATRMSMGTPSLFASG